MSKTAIVITGPTASGKTLLAIRLAQHLNTSIISADSRQCYKELNIGVAKPSAKELAMVKHFFISSHSIHETVNTKVFEEYALQKANEIFKKSDYVIVCGGTGLYIKAFCEGIDEIPDIPASIRNEVNELYRENGIQWLTDEVEKQDTGFIQFNTKYNPHRLMRALEVKTFTGKSINEFQQNLKVKRPFKIVKIGIDLPKPQLHENINNRVDGMMKAGLLEEAQSLQPFQHLNALQTVGYKEIFEQLGAKLELQQATEQIKLHTRQYAKRQLTWFRSNKEIKWIDNPLINVEEIMSLIKSF